MANRTYDDYIYDAAGQRITHTNSLGGVEKTFYDSLGRVSQTRTYLGFNTNYTYTYSNAIVGLGGIVGSGWQKTTAQSDGMSLIDKMDMFQHITWHQDLGGHQFTYNYNRAGWLMGQTSTTGQNIAYTHYNNGFIQSLHDKALGMYTYYEYDYDGNKTFEGYISLKNPVSVASGAKDYYQYANITYDAQNRITSITDPKANISYEYDAVGNRRRVRSVYHDGINGSQRIQDFWYTYDNVNRFLITMGSLAVTSTGVATAARGTSAADTTVTINKGAAGGAGVAISYNLAGERALAVNAVDGTTEAYTYTADGYLTDVSINGVLRSRRTNDALGRVTNLAQYNASAVNDYNKATIYDADNRVASESGTDGTSTYYYGVNGGDLYRTVNVNAGTTINTYYGYQFWDDAKITAIQEQAYNPAIKGNNALWRPGYSDISYDVNGHISGAVDRVGNRHFTYINDSNGQIMVRDEITGAIDRVTYRTSAYQNPGSVADKITRYYYVDGKRVGDISNNGPSQTDYAQALANRNAPKGNYANWKPVASADFDQNYQAISPAYPGNVATTYTVRNGDTLQSIARNVWGDSAMWYLIADANGLASNSAIVAGQVLTIPNKVTNIHNNAGTFKPYNPGEAIGDTSPTLPVAPNPPVKKKGCGGLLSIFVAVIAIVATIYTAGAFAVAAGATGGTFAAGVTALGSGTLGFGAAAVAGAVGSIAGQVAGIALGVQDKFSWGAVAAGAIGAGIGASGVLGSIAGGNVVGQAIAGNIINQGVGIITGAQKGFSWAGVAAAAIAAPITSKINSIKGSSFAQASPLNAGIAGAAAGVLNSTVNELTRVALVGGKLNWASVAIGGIQGGIYGYGEGLRARANALNQPVYGSTFDADRQARAQMLGFGNGSGSTAQDAPSIIRLTQDEVISNAMARQAAEKRSLFDTSTNQGGLAATNDLGVLQRGGLTSSFSTAQGEGVVYGREQYMKVMPKASVADNVKANFEAMNGGMSLLDPNSKFYGLNVNQYINANSVSNLLIDPATGLKDMRYTSSVKNSEQARKIANSPKMQYDNYILQDGDKNPSISLEQARSNFNWDVGGALAGSTIQGAVFMAAPQVMGLKTIVGITGVADVGGQYVNSNGFTTDDYKLGQTLFVMSSAALTAKLGVKLTSTPYYGVNTLNAGLLGGANATASTVFTNYYYGENKDPVYSYALGFGFGTGGYFVGTQLATSLSKQLFTPTFNPNVPRLNQNSISPRADYWGNAAVGTSASSISSFIDAPDKK